MTTAAQRRKHAEKIQKDALQSRLDAVQPLIDEVSKLETLAEKLAALRTVMADLDTTLATHYRDPQARTETTPASNVTGHLCCVNVPRQRHGP